MNVRDPCSRIRSPNPATSSSQIILSHLPVPTCSVRTIFGDHFMALPPPTVRLTVGLGHPLGILWEDWPRPDEANYGLSDSWFASRINMLSLGGPLCPALAAVL